jgi:hypothetical protein
VDHFFGAIWISFLARSPCGSAWNEPRGLTGIGRSRLCSLSRLALRKDFQSHRINVAKKLVGRWVNAAVVPPQFDEWLKVVLQPSCFLLVGEPCQPAEVPPIATQRA